MARTTDVSRSGAAARVSVIIPSWNGRDWLLRCLATLQQQTHGPPAVIVVDNGSADGSAAAVRAHYPDTVLIESKRNLGFAGGCNIGIAHALRAGAEYVALLNQDAEAEPDWLAALVRMADSDPGIGALASRLLFATHRTLLNGAGLELNAAGQAWDRAFARVDGARWQEPAEVVGASGGAMLLRADALRDVGAFDPVYFGYYEDLDLSVRLWEAGYRVAYAPDAVAFHRSWHARGAPTPARRILLGSNRWRFVLKHFPLSRLRFQPAAEWRAWQAQGSAGVTTAAHVAAGVAARTLRGLPSTLRYRATRRHRGAARERWWRFVQPAAVAPPAFRPTLDYQLLTSGSEARRPRILMGVTDVELGEGWYPLSAPCSPTRDAPPAPAFRWIGRAATCYLRVAHPGAYILQLHVCGGGIGRAPRHVCVVCNHARGGAFAVTPAESEWRTVQMPIRLDRVTANIQLVVDAPVLREESGSGADLGIQINEVSLLTADSPFLRRGMQPTTLAGGGIAGAHARN